ncbi:hypothetical protein MTO96_031797 [Rhipicephalus appendiculatus]
MLEVTVRLGTNRRAIHLANHGNDFVRGQQCHAWTAPADTGQYNKPFRRGTGDGSAEVGSPADRCPSSRDGPAGRVRGLEKATSSIGAAVAPSF